MRTGRPKKKHYNHRLKFSEYVGVNTKTMALIDNLERLSLEYGESCVDTLLHKLLINMTYDEMVNEISGRAGISISKPILTQAGATVESSAEPSVVEAEDDISETFAIG